MMERERFGKFKIVRLLARGMTDVYLAEDCERRLPVIVKIIENAYRATARATVEAESRGARIQHDLHANNPEILEIYEWGEHEGQFFLAMEYFPGRTVAEILNSEGKLEPVRAVRYAAEMCRQLRTLHEFAWSNGTPKPAVIHGDIKPSNIQIGAGDQLRLLDFGIAKVIQPGRELTHHELGSPSYCSPERLREYRIDVHADLWAAGVTLFEMVTGAPPFQARDTRELEKLIQTKPPLAIPAGCPPKLASILRKSLAAELDDRYSSAAAFESDLHEFLVTPPPRFSSKTVARPLVSTVPRFVAAPYSLMAALLAGILAGLLLFVPLAYHLRLEKISRSLNERKDYTALPQQALLSDWQLYHIVQARASWWRRLVSTASAEASFRANLIDSAAGLIDKFRRSSDDEVRFNWSSARLCAFYTLQLDPADRKALGEFHLANGFLYLRDRSRAGVHTSYAEFRKAADLLPDSPVPPLGLARLYTHNVHNIGAALAALHRAQALGYHLGPREFEQQADAYLFRAEQELARAHAASDTSREDALRWLRLARDDFNRARNLYEPINGFSHSGMNLARIEKEQNERADLENTLLQSPAPKTHMVLLNVRLGRRGGGGTLRWR